MAIKSQTDFILALLVTGGAVLYISSKNKSCRRHAKLSYELQGMDSEEAAAQARKDCKLF